MSMTDDIADKLAAEFNRSDVHWRAQTVSKNGDKALALAYIDARDVMERLDSVMGPANWQDRYETHGARVVCYLSLRFGDEWITKADGAGDTAVEAEKGGLSDAFKRAAVKWGIGRYLYDLDAPWVPCETYEAHGKKHWRRWTVDPWSCVKEKAGAPEPQQAPADSDEEAHAQHRDDLVRQINGTDDPAVLEDIGNDEMFSKAVSELPEPMRMEVRRVFTLRRRKLAPTGAAA